MSPLPPRLLVFVGETYERMEIADRLIEAIANRMRLEVQDLTMEVIEPRQFRDRQVTGADWYVFQPLDPSETVAVRISALFLLSVY